MYELIDHTADIGFRARGSSLEELFINAAYALFDIEVHEKRPCLAAIDVPLIVEADSLEDLFVNWLRELQYIFETRRLVLSKFWIDEIDERHIVGQAKGVVFDDSRHEQKLSIKAVTYHQLEITRDENGDWLAKVIFDI
jgi:SHS2 domain-containing protein